MERVTSTVVDTVEVALQLVGDLAPPGARGDGGHSENLVRGDQHLAVLLQRRVEGHVGAEARANLEARAAAGATGAGAEGEVGEAQHRARRAQVGGRVCGVTGGAAQRLAAPQNLNGLA